MLKGCDYWPGAGFWATKKKTPGYLQRKKNEKQIQINLLAVQFPALNQRTPDNLKSKVTDLML